jgi:hypothetical protein
VAAILTKDPQARLDYPFSWADWLEAGDAITTATVTVPAGITLDGTTIVGSTVVAWLTGGTAGDTYEVTCHIETTDGRIDERTRTIRVRQR